MPNLLVYVWLNDVVDSTNLTDYKATLQQDQYFSVGERSRELTDVVPVIAKSKQ